MQGGIGRRRPAQPIIPVDQAQRAKHALHRYLSRDPPPDHDRGKRHPEQAGRQAGGQQGYWESF